MVFAEFKVQITTPEGSLQPVRQALATARAITTSVPLVLIIEPGRTDDIVAMSLSDFKRWHDDKEACAGWKAGVP